MIIKLSYTDGETAQNLKKILQAREIKFETKSIAGEGHSILQFIITGGDKRQITREINEPTAVQLAYNRSVVARILKVNQVNFADSGQNMGLYVSEFKVTILDLTATRYSKREIVGGAPAPGGWNRLRIDEEDKEIKKIVQTARRTVQCLGLDFGMVHIALTKLRRPIVINVDPSPVLSEKGQKNLIAYLTSLLEKTYEYEKIMLGADPEFIMINKDTGKMIASSQFFPRFGPVGCDSIRIANRQQRPIAEVRPDPAYEPLKVIENLNRVMQSAIKLVPYRNIEWLAGSQPVKGYPIGGHIHFGGIKPNSNLLRALDNYLAIPVMLMEKTEGSVKRRQKYGHLSDYRIKEHGGFEYRTIASWLVSPEIAKGVLCLSRLIINNYENLTTNYFLKAETQEAFYRADKEYFQDIYTSIWRVICGLPGADQYMEHLESINRLCSNLTGWDENQDIRQSWGITIPKKKYRAEQVPVKAPAITRNSVRTNVRVR